MIRGTRARFLTGASSGALIITFAAASLAHAQDGGAEGGQTAVDEIVVTGSLLAGSSEAAAQPVDVISSAELQRQGSPTTVNLVKTITVAQSSFGEANRGVGSAAGTATINLRGFGSQRTLVLLNGRRMAGATSPIAEGAADINFIPQAAIGRIEILREGAAATYGSDAVGGVVNFITRRDLEGFELAANYMYIDGSDGDYDVSLSHGLQFERGNTLVTATYRRRSRLPISERDWAVRPYAEAPFSGWSTASNPGVFQTGPSLSSPASFNQPFVDNGCSELGGVLANPANPSAGCRFQFTQFDNMVNQEDHYQLYGELNVDLTDTLEFHGELLWASHDVPAERASPSSATTQFPTPIAASGGSPGDGTSPFPAVGLNEQSRFYVPPQNPGLVAFLANPANCPSLGPICTNAAANGVITSQTQWRPYGWGGNPQFPELGGAELQETFGRGFRVAGELRGRLGDSWSWVGGVSYSDNDGRATVGDVSVTRMQLAMRGLGGPNCNPATGQPGTGGCLWFNPFANAIARSATNSALENPYYSPAAANSLEVIRWMHGVRETRLETQNVTADFVVSGDTGLQAPGGPVEVAAGLQWRYDRTAQSSDDLSNQAAVPCVDSLPFGDGTPVCSAGTGPYSFWSAVQNFDVDRSVWAGFAEARAPLTSTLEVTGAVRYEEYGGAIGSTFNPKLAVLWRPLDWLSLRASVGSTFRAPPQDWTSPGSTRTLAQFNLPGGALYRPVDVQNEVNLEPETADTFNAGALLQWGGLRASVDYYRFKLEGELTTETSGAIVSTMFPSASPATWRCGDAQFRQRFTFANDGNPATEDCAPANLLGIRTNRINGPAVDTSGVDLQFTYDLDPLLWDGALTLGGDATYVIEYKRGAVVTKEGFVIARAEDRAGTSDLLVSYFSYPRIRANLYLNWRRDIHNLRWTSHFKSGTTNKIGGFPDYKSEDEITHDLSYVVELPNDLTLAGTVNNVFDADPPFTRSPRNFDMTNAWFLGRTFSLNVRKRF